LTFRRVKKVERMKMEALRAATMMERRTRKRWTRRRTRKWTKRKRKRKRKRSLNRLGRKQRQDESLLVLLFAHAICSGC
jgi:hypothetical protein